MNPSLYIHSSHNQPFSRKSSSASVGSRKCLPCKSVLHLITPSQCFEVDVQWKKQKPMGPSFSFWSITCRHGDVAMWSCVKKNNIKKQTQSHDAQQEKQNLIDPSHSLAFGISRRCPEASRSWSPRLYFRGCGSQSGAETVRLCGSQSSPPDSS